MGENSDLQKKYAEEKSEIESLINSLQKQKSKKKTDSERLKS